MNAKNVFYLLVLLVVLLVGGYLFYARVPQSEERSEQGQSLSESERVLEDVRTQTGLKTGVLYDAQVTWFVKNAQGTLEGMSVSGREFREEKVSAGKLQEVYAFFTQQGFEKHGYTTGRSAYVGLVGFRKDALGCTVKDALSAEALVRKLDERMVQVTCASSNVIASSSVPALEAVKAKLAEAYEISLGKVVVRAAKETETFLQGTATIPRENGQESNLSFFAVKTNGSVELAYHGTDPVPCSVLEAFGGEPKQESGTCPPESERVARRDRPFTVVLKTNPTTGYQWKVETNEAVVRLLNREYIVPSQTNGVGVGSVEVFTFLPVAAGTDTIRFSSVRSWEEGAQPAEVKNVNVRVTP